LLHEAVIYRIGLAALTAIATTSGSASWPSAAGTGVLATTKTMAATQTVSAAGTTYYVDSAGGSDASAGTSPSTAWKTLAMANKAYLAPGDALLFKRAGFWSGSLRPRGSGVGNSPILIGAYGIGAAPVIRDSGTCVAVTGSYVVVRNLAVKACAWAGVAISGSHNTVEGNLVTDTAAAVYIKPGACENKVLRNRLLSNNRMSVLTATPAKDDSGAFGVLLRGDGNEIAYNTISQSNAFSYDYGRDGSAVEIFGGIGNRIHHNLAVNNDAFAELGNSRSADNVFAYNVVRSSLRTSVFVVTRGSASSYGPVLGTKLYNNSVLMTGTSSQGFVCHARCSGEVLAMRNNVIQAVAKVGYADAPFDEDHGLYYGGSRQFSLGPHSVVASPRFVEAGTGNLRLSASSPGIDRGTRLGYDRDFIGRPVPADGNSDGKMATDLGAFELHPL
jgi:hypothetical protein